MYCALGLGFDFKFIKIGIVTVQEIYMRYHLLKLVDTFKENLKRRLLALDCASLFHFNNNTVFAYSVSFDRKLDTKVYRSSG